MTDTSKVAVAVRVRPLLEKFGEAYSVKCAKKATEDTICMTHPTDDSPNSGKQYNFTYNYVFDEDDSQKDVYEAVKELVDSSLDGHNATIFTYGQTGSGKTHTVLGNVDAVDGKISIGSKTGLFMRVLDDLIKYKRANSKSSHVIVTIAILEIHRENLKDLLNNSKMVDLQRNKFGDDAVPNIAMTEVCTLQDCFDVFQIGNANRSVAQTAMNDVSSRSHAVFMIDILQQEKTAENPEPPDPIALYAAEFVNEPASAEEKFPIRKSRLCLVDLAGSERLKKSQAEGDTLKETQAINASLSALGNVVNALFEGKSFVGYRDSKLTMLLKASFERSNAKVLLITNISPISESFGESMGSLRFADRVMSLKAKKVFIMDADSEQDYLDSLRMHAELCADVRIAIASHDLHLHGGKKLKTLRGRDGNFSADAISKLHEEHKKQMEEVRKQKLEQLVSKIITQRETVEEREMRITDELGWQLKCEEQELLLQAVNNEAAAYEEGIATKKEEYKVLKKLVKNVEKASAAIKGEVDRVALNLSAMEQECMDLMAQLETEGVESAPPEPPAPPAPLVSAPEPTPAAATIEVAAERIPDPEPTHEDEDSDEDSEERPPPKKHQSKVSFNTAGSTTHLYSVNSPASGGRIQTPEQIHAAAKAAHDTAAELRKQRELLSQEMEIMSGSIRQIAEAACQDDPESEDEEEVSTKAKLKLEKKRMKELLKASGLKKAEIKQILDRMS
mmetsp:Transcript_59005/g.105236  ORF Transcript_59005/g.105236 Transcript_59005/m.105236 type:complete len:733 (-) Transcript_59005:187-2385(-)